MDAFAAIRLAIGGGCLVAAAASDVRTRRVPHAVWIGLGTVGLAILATELLVQGASAERYALLPATAILFYAIFIGEPLLDEQGFHARPARIGLFAASAALVLGSAVSALGRGGPEAVRYAELLTMPGMVVVHQIFHQVGVLHGGADAAALIALTLLVPTYPDASPYPLLQVDPRVGGAMRLLFPFSLVVLADAALLFLLVPLAYFLRNAARGDLAFPQAFFGYVARLDALPRHAWLMEKIDSRGEHVLALFPRRGGDTAAEAERLRASGRDRAWVQPKVPFIVPILGGFVLAFTIGNALLALFPR